MINSKPPNGEKPRFIMLGGRGGSGKSWFKGNVYNADEAIVLDADEIKGKLPEYEGWNAQQVHEESSDILEKILARAMKEGLNVVLDATMKTAVSAMKKVQTFKDAGYQIEAHYMHLPRQEAAKRAVSRFMGKTKRYVPVEVVLSNTSNEDTFDMVKKVADKWSFRDNNVPQGQPPILISENSSSDKK
jgi:predicted kinase